MKWFHSFRARLILTVFPVVAGITIATLVLAEWKFMESYRKLFEEQFDSQIDAFTNAKEKRSRTFSAVLEKIARQPEVLAALARHNFAEAGQILRPQLEALASERTQSEAPGDGVHLGGGGGGFRPQQAAGKRGDDNDRQHAGSNRAAQPRLPFSQLPYIAIIDPEGNFLSALKKNAPGGKSSAGFASVLLLPSRPASGPLTLHLSNLPAPTSHLSSSLFTFLFYLFISMIAG